jgi:cardiolipin synthase
MTISSAAIPVTSYAPDGDSLELALDRATATRPIGGNLLQHYADSPRALDAMLALVEGATRWVHFENYIIRDDRTGTRFATALAERARAGVRVRVLYDALGSLGTSRRFWRTLREAGAEVRAFRPLFSSRLLELVSRDHRKLAVADGVRAMVGGMCIGDEWAGDPERSRLPWRDSMVMVHGPAAVAFDRAFARVWERSGGPLPPDELEADPAEAGSCTVRAIAGVPGRARMYRALELLAASARDRLWITDAYLIAPRLLLATFLDAGRSGVDVRLLVPGTSDLPVLRDATRAGYRDLLRAGVRIFEWRGAMLHAKTLLVDHRWSRVGSSNLNLSSLVGNFELDLLVESETLAAELGHQFLRDLSSSREIVLKARRRPLPARLVGAPAMETPAPPAPAHWRSGYEVGATAVVTLRRLLGGARRSLAGAATVLLVLAAGLLLTFPRVMSGVMATAALVLAIGTGLYALERRRALEADDSG